MKKIGPMFPLRAGLQEGDEPVQAAVFGARLATEAQGVVGVQKTFELMQRLG